MTVSSLYTTAAVSNLALLVQIWKELTKYSINKYRSIVKDLKDSKWDQMKATNKQNSVIRKNDRNLLCTNQCKEYIIIIDMSDS